MSDAKKATKPAGYRRPTYEQVKDLLAELRPYRDPVINRIIDTKRARRNDWNEYRKKLPESYKDLPMVIGESEIPEMITRIAGLVTKQEPIVQVIPPSGHRPDVSKASKEEALLEALRITIQDQQDRDIWSMGVDAQLAWGESWISIWHEGQHYSPEYERGKDEKGGDYSARIRKMQLIDGVPIRLEDHDPQTIFPLWDTRDRLQAVIIETEHPYYEIKDVFGYTPTKDNNGNIVDWSGKAIGAAMVPSENSVNDRGPVDVSHDRGFLGSGGDTGVQGSKVKKIVFLDKWSCVVFIDGFLVESWEHGFGQVPMAYAAGKTTSDRDPAWMSSGIADAAIQIARQVVYYQSILASNGYLYGFPTPFITNPLAGEVGPDGQPVGTRQIQLAEMNVLGVGEEITFPLEGARMGPDFMRTIELLNGKLDAATLGGFNKALGTDIAGYALAQVRSMQMAVLSAVYRNLNRQWRKLHYMMRHIVKEDLTGGIPLRGAIEETDDGKQYRPIMEFGPEHTTDFAIEVTTPEGILQDEMAERKSAIEMHQAGLWSKRRAMEKTGVEDPSAEDEEIAIDRITSSPAADQTVLTLVEHLIAARAQALQQSQNTPFGQLLEQAKQGLLNGRGMPQNQPGIPQNALPGGQPMDQNPTPTTPQQGGPNAGPPAGGPGPDLQQFGAPGIPGGVKDAPQVPVGAPG